MRSVLVSALDYGRAGQGIRTVRLEGYRGLNERRWLDLDHPGHRHSRADRSLDGADGHGQIRQSGLAREDEFAGDEEFVGPT